MENKYLSIKNYSHILTIVLFFFSCLFMYNFYKALSGFIANGFREIDVMLPIILSYLLPVFVYLYYVYDTYITKTTKICKIVYSSLVIIWSTINLIGIFNNLPIYISNNMLGVYETIPSIILVYPYDSIVINIVLFIIQIFNLLLIVKPIKKVVEIKELIYHPNTLKLNILEYILLSVLAILVFVFVGAFLISFKAIENALYDPTYIFLQLWVLTPLFNLLYLAFKFEQNNIPNKSKTILLGINILTNIVFITILLIIEAINPSFLVHIGKPLFAITFSISIPIEPLVILGITIISIIINTIKFVLLITNKKSL